MDATFDNTRTEARSEARAPATSGAPRWQALDLFRFVAVCLMVQGHVFTALLEPFVKSQRWYGHHSFVHGYTAPMFLFGAGLAFGYTTFRRWDDHGHFGAAVKKRFKRYAWLLAIGYGLHLPTLSLSGLLELDDPDAIGRMVQVDVLQHIGVSLVICQLLARVIRNQRAFAWVIGSLSLGAFIASPWVWTWDLSQGELPIWLAGYINASTQSTFPLFPWAGFTYLGIFVAHLAGLGQDHERSIAERLSWPFLVMAAFFIFAPIIINRAGFDPFPPHNFWKVNPLFSAWRVGNVMLVLAGFCFLERTISRAGWLEKGVGGPEGRWLRKLMPWIKLIAAESLIIYVAHLLILYGSVVNPGLKNAIGGNAHGVLIASGIALVLMASMVVLAKLWSDLREQQAFTWVRWTMIVLLALVMLTS